MTVLQLQNLLVDIPNRQRNWPLTLSLASGQIWGVLGANGVGKTSLLHTLAGLRTPGSGSVNLDGKRITAYSRRDVAKQLGIMFQERQEHFPATVLETVLMGRHPYLSPWQMESSEDVKLAEMAIQTLDLTEMTSRLVNTLSGGERQRVALAVLLAQNPQIWLVDEPTNHLDLHHQVAVMALLRTQAASGKTLMMSLHDVNLAARWCSHVLLLYPDQAPLSGPADELLTIANLEPLYQQALVCAEIGGNAVFMPATSPKIG